jgi:hypothetical protein
LCGGFDIRFNFTASPEVILAQKPWRAEMPTRKHVSSIKTSLIRALSERAADQRGKLQPVDR